MMDSKKCLITGTLKIMSGEVLMPADDAEIRLFKDGKLISMTITDPLGHFRHELVKNSGEYEFEFVADNCTLTSQTVIVGNTDNDIGVITLK